MSALYAWLRRHPMLVDGGLAAALLFAGVGPAFAKGMFLGIPLAFGLTVPIVFRRKYPIGAYYTAVAAGGLQVALGIRPAATDVAILILLYTLAAYTPRRTSVWGLAVCLAGSAVGILRWTSLGSHTVLGWLTAGAMLFAGPALLAWVLGDSMRYRRAYYASLEDRAARLEAERDAQAQIAAVAERARIARELHDVIAHTLTVSLLHVTSARLAVEHDPADAERALAEAERLGRETLAEVRMAVGMLRQPDDSLSTAPLPGVDGLPALVERFRSAGAKVTLSVDGDTGRLHATTGLAVYRIVQEALTNAAKHAHGAPMAVRLTVDADTVRLAVDSAGEPGTGTGLGLLSMRERAESLGGSCRAGPGGQGWLVEAALPLGASRRREGAT